MSASVELIRVANAFAFQSSRCSIVVTSKQRKFETSAEILAFTDPRWLMPDLSLEECRFGTKVIAILRPHKSGTLIGHMPEGVLTPRSPRLDVLCLSYCVPSLFFTSAFFSIPAGQIQYDASDMGNDVTHPILFGKNIQNLSPFSNVTPMIKVNNFSQGRLPAFSFCVVGYQFIRSKLLQDNPLLSASTRPMTPPSSVADVRAFREKRFFTISYSWCDHKVLAAKRRNRCQHT